MRHLLITAVFGFAGTGLAADLAPALQWIQVTGGSGNSTVAAATADRQGNLYIAGSTTSLDFPVTARAAQAHAGGSMLLRIDLANGAASRLYPANLPPITFAAANPANSGILYAAANNQVWKSDDAGSTWAAVSQFSSGTGVFGLAVDPAGSGALYAATSKQGVLKSVDGGATWSGNSGFSAQAVWIEPSSPQVIFSSVVGALQRSADGGETWAPVDGLTGATVLAFDPFAAGTVYAAGGNSIAKSTDDGRTFAPLGHLPEDTAFTALTPHPQRPGVLLAGSFQGIYESTDGGATWILKLPGHTSVLVADPTSAAWYANVSGHGIVKSADGFATSAPIGPDEPGIRQLLLSGGRLFEIAAPSNDVYVLKLDRDGNVVYATYFGGNGDDTAAALAAGSDGSIYVTGTTTSSDLPVTAGAYSRQLPSQGESGSSYVFKLNADGSLGWATYFTGTQSAPASIVVDGAGSAYIGGSSSGQHPTTAGAYQTTFQQTSTCTGFIGCFAGPTSAFVTRFDAKGSRLIYSTYVPNDGGGHIVQSAQALALDPAGNAWVAAGTRPNLVPSGQANANVVELDAAGAAVLASAYEPGLGDAAAIALDGNSNVYVAGSYRKGNTPFPASPGAFQAAPQPAIPLLPYGPEAGGGLDVFVAKFDRSLKFLAATLVGGELPDTATSLAVDESGMVIVGGYTDSKAFPTHAPFQASFAERTGFVAGLDGDLTRLAFSTYTGDGRPFAVRAAAPDGAGNLLLAGSTLTPGGTFVGGDNGASFTSGGAVVANKIALRSAPAARLDSVENSASHIAGPLAPGETVTAVGAGFGPAAQIVLDGAPLETVAVAGSSIVARMPDMAADSGAHTVQVANAGTLSNAMIAPAAAASPGIYSVDGSGAGQGYILNSDGTLNSPANPAAPGSAITILAAGPGRFSLADGYAVTEQAPAVFIDGFYCNGIAARVGPVAGLPGSVYQLSVRVPDPAALAQNNPDLKGFRFPAQSQIQLVMGAVNPLNPANSPMRSQSGVYINIGQ